MVERAEDKENNNTISAYKSLLLFKTLGTGEEEVFYVTMQS